MSSLDSTTETAESNGLATGFRLTGSGVEYYIVEEDAAGEWVPICSYLEVAAITKDADNGSWGRLLVVKDLKGKFHQWAMPMKLMAGDGASYRETLLEMGLRIEPGRTARELLSKYISTCSPTQFITCADHNGWHDERVFVLPDETFGGASVVLQQEFLPDNAFRIKGSLDDWRDSIGKYCVGNSRLLLSASAAFAAPLLHILGHESGGFHFRGASSIGKTTTLRVAASIWGGGGQGGYIRQWRATGNALESVARLHSDALLCLDEISQVGSHEAADIAYMIANGMGKTRANRSGFSRRPATWRTLFLSTGEISLADKIAESGKQRVSAGQEVRIVDITADAGAGLGIFEELHGLKNGDELARHLRDTSERYYGVTIREYLREIVKADRDELRLAAEIAIEDLVKSLDISNADGQVKRVARRFGLAAAGGELAILFKIAPWPKDAAIGAAKTCFESWLAARGGAAPLEVQRLKSQLRLFFEQHGESRFTDLDAKEFVNDLGERKHLRQTYNRAGFRRAGPDGLEYFVLPEAFRAELCKGFDARWAARTLLEEGYLKGGENNRPDAKQRIPDYPHPMRVYHFNSRLFDDCGSNVVTPIQPDERANHFS